ncbi:hypothetical protein M2334_002419 [Sphingobium sp. B11D3D]|nr:hypothetical protein [Sphingobium sp. B11D3D]
MSGAGRARADVAAQLAAQRVEAPPAWPGRLGLVVSLWGRQAGIQPVMINSRTALALAWPPTL